jgi:hypothetical protein
MFSHFTMELLTTSTWQVVSYNILGSAIPLEMARRSSVQQQQVCRRLWERSNTSSIIPNHPPHAPRVAVSATALTDSRSPSAPFAQSEAAQPLPLQQQCAVMPPKEQLRLRSLVGPGAVGIAAPCRGHRDAPCALRARFACSQRVPLHRGGRRGFHEYVRTRL